MSKVYYGVEPYTGKIICHTRPIGSKNGYHFGQLVDASKVAKGKIDTNGNWYYPSKQYSSRNPQGKDIYNKIDNQYASIARNTGLEKKYKRIKNAKNIKAKEAKVNAMNNSSFNKSYVFTYDNNDEDYYNIGLDPTIAKRQLFRGKGNSDLVKNAYNLVAKATRVKRLNDKYSKKADR